MATVKFPCPHCAKPMAVGDELLGRKVRCPHCQQVIVAPTPEPAAPLPQFNAPTAENDAEDLFGAPAGGDAEDLFASGETPTPEMPPEHHFGPSPNGLGHADAFAAPTPSPSESPPEPPPVGAAPRTAPASGGAITMLALTILVPYSVLMTVVAATYYFKAGSQKHPLEMVPDVGGEFQGTTKKTGGPTSRVLDMPKPDQPLPANLVTSLNVPITLGDLEVTPLAVERRPVRTFLLKKNRDAPDEIPPKNDVLVLRLKLKNVSKDVVFYPTDPYFRRRPRDESDKPYTLIEAGGKFYFGGMINFNSDSNRDLQRSWVEGQEDDAKPLMPGAERETTFTTRPVGKDAPAVEAVTKAAGEIVWRVHLRRGLVSYYDSKAGRDREVSASGVVGVRFTADQVKRKG